MLQIITQKHDTSFAEVSSDQKAIMRVSTISIAVNLALSVFKLIAGIIAGSGAMVSDAVHSASDVFSTVVVIIGIKLAAKESDKEHPYGHERLECVAAIILAVILLGTGLVIGYTGLLKIISSNTVQIQAPGKLALIAAVVSIAVKEWMYHFTRRIAKKVNSGAMMADAWHHRSDALSSVGSFAGVLGARLGFPVFDPAAGIIICCFIVKVSVDIFKDAASKMIDTSCSDETVDRLRDIVAQQDGVIRIDDIRTREFGNRMYVDVEIAADGNATLFEAHTIAEHVHNKIEETFPLVKHIMVHVNPAVPE